MEWALPRRQRRQWSSSVFGISGITGVISSSDWVLGAVSVRHLVPADMHGAESGEFEARIVQACCYTCLPACRGQRETGDLILEGTAA